MQINESQIKDKRVVGRLKNGQPVIYISTHGGLHAMFARVNGKLDTLAAMPHYGMCVWLAERKCPDIIWDRAMLLEG